MSEKYQFTEEEIDKAKSEAVNYTARLYSPEELDENIKTAKYCLTDEHYDHDTWSEQLRDLDAFTVKSECLVVLLNGLTPNASENVSACSVSTLTTTSLIKLPNPLDFGLFDCVMLY